ncbi:hypothetical protein NPX13_g11244 [Xylaria arbuscula]|uniref:Uncharacterized protein n=1 Tax=Xylaria arbuscula TaxID=114810 RepID=A0A9W8N380_9PEZI|nr:hypothetical protein NPX13_g11244 [Xylaria arbuscula]
MIERSLAGRSIFTTKAGYIGLAPESAVPGDEICVIVGCTTPFVLRPVTDCQRIVVGDCYIEGFMDDEAVLGLLPPGVQRKISPPKHHTFGDTGLVDPRLKNWPEINISAIPDYGETGTKYLFQVNVDDLQCHGIHNARYYDLV